MEQIELEMRIEGVYRLIREGRIEAAKEECARIRKVAGDAEELSKAELVIRRIEVIGT
ncbi:MAG: hypothetical protein NUW37_07285 [Planctomycetes bacterium]|nr:hypothetical protein [Planctomycetota bacterium]